MDPGHILEKKANNKLTIASRFGFLMNVFSPEPKDQECAELFKQAGSKYITEKDYVSAIRCLKQSNELYSQSTDNGYLMCSVIKLIIQYGKDVCTTDEIVGYYVQLGEYYTTESNMSYYNEQYVNIAKIYEDLNDYDTALTMLNKCVDHKHGGKIIENKGHLLIKLEKYKEASDAFLELIEKMHAAGKMLYLLGDHIFMFMLCFLASDDIVGAKMGLEFVSRFDSTFDKSTRGILIENIINALENNNTDEFESSCAQFDCMIKLKPNQVTLLTQVKSTIIGNSTDEMYINEDEDGLC